MGIAPGEVATAQELAEVNGRMRLVQGLKCQLANYHN